MSWRADPNGTDPHEYIWPDCDDSGCVPLKEGVIHLYIAGPMRGHDLYNFPTFDSAAAWLREDGYKVISPAELDRKGGFDPAVDAVIDAGFVKKAMRRDIEALLKVDGVALLPGWETSAGVKTELAVARGLGLPVWELVRKDDPRVYAWSHLEPLSVEYQETQQHLRTTWAERWAGQPPTIIDPVEKVGGWIRTETRVTAATGGEKCQKPQQVHQIPPDFLLGLGEVYATAQATKYPDVAPGRPNWSKGYPWSLSYSALQRHLAAFWKGEYHDPDDGLPHLLHAAWHCATLFTWHEEGIAPECDDRPAYLRPLVEHDLYIDRDEVDRITTIKETTP